jgi:hypothetical protein
MAKKLTFVFGLLCLVTVGAASGADNAATLLPNELRLSIDPTTPTTQDFVAAHVDYQSSGRTYLEGVEIVGRQIELHFGVSCGVILCEAGLYTFDIPIGRLEPGPWTILPFVDSFPLAHVELDFVVEAVPSSAELMLLPVAPTQADLVRLQIPFRVPGCESQPTLSTVERRGNLLRLELTAGARLPGCVDGDATAEVGGFLVKLGALAPGDYRVELWGLPAEPTEPPTAPIQLDDLAFTVAPTDTVDLLGRYRVGISWRAPDGATGTAKPVAGGSEESALFSFFDADNWEVMVKVLDGCAINGNRWIFLSAATDVEFTLTVEDLQGAAAPYVHTSGPGLAPPLADIAAFACLP